MRFTAFVLLFCFSWSFITFAQTPNVSPAVVPNAAPAIVAAPVVVAVSGGIMGWLTAHGGLQAAVLFLVGSAMALLSTVRQVLYKYDGLDMSQPVPPQYDKLNAINKVCYYLGVVLDFLSGNTQHK